MATIPHHLLQIGLEEAANGIIILDCDEKILLWNRRMVQSSGTSASHALGRELSEVFPAIRQGRVHQCIRTCLERGLPALLSQTLNPTLFPLFIPGSPTTSMRQQVQIIPLTGDDSKRFCMVQIFDVTPMFKRERYIASREQEFRALFERAASGNALIDSSDGRLLRVNQKLCEISGYSASELCSMQLGDLVAPDFHEPVKEFLNKLQRLELNDYSGEIGFLHRDGSKRWGYLSIAMENHGMTKLTTKAVLVLLDITESKAYEQALQQAKEAAEAHNRAKSDFLARMSHELRTPLNAVLGFSDIMRGESGRSDEDKNYLKIIHRSGTYLLQLINDVLDMAKIEAGHTRLETTDFDLRQLVHDVEAMSRVRATQKGVRLSLDWDARVPDHIHGDPIKFRQILHNLLSNAVKFTDQGEVVLRLYADSSDPDLIILHGEVQDDGPGIRPEDVDLIFHPFEQLDREGSQVGTGLGLAITAEFIKMMHGNIEVESQPGRGSLFRFQVQVKPVQEEIPQEPLPSRRQVVGLAPGQPECRVLIAEDNPESSELLVNLLVNAGFAVRVVKDGAEAVRCFQQWHPRFIWMDRWMPAMDGLAAIRKIRSLPGGKEVKIVVQSASVFDDQIREALQEGADDFISKPYTSARVFDCMAAHLDVRYQYVETEEETAEAVIDYAALQRLPAELLESLRNAVVLLDAEAMLSEIDRISEVDKDLADSLTEYVESLEHDLLIEVIDQAAGRNLEEASGHPDKHAGQPQFVNKAKGEDP